METTESLKRKLDTTEALQSVVKTMKSLAASNIRQYERAVESLESYTHAVQLGFRAMLRNELPAGGMPEIETGRRGVAIIFGSDQGMCGQLNDLIAERAERELSGEDSDGPGGDTFIIGVGHRVGGRLIDAGFSIEKLMEVPGSAEGITAKVQELLLDIERLREEQSAGRVAVFYNKYESGASFSPNSFRLLPIDERWLETDGEEKWPSKAIPQYTMPAGELFAALVRQYIFIGLFRAFAESLASENASRLASMQGAEKNIEERIGELTTMYHQQRQKAITEELLDIISGFTTTA